MSDLTEIKNLLRTILKDKSTKTALTKKDKQPKENKLASNQAQLEDVNKINNVYNEVNQKEIEKNKRLPIIQDKLENLEEQKGIINRAKILEMDDDKMTRLHSKLIKIEDEIRKLKNEANKLNKPIDVQKKIRLYDDNIEESLKNYAEAMGYGIFRLENNI